MNNMDSNNTFFLNTCSNNLHNSEELFLVVVAALSYYQHQRFSYFFVIILSYECFFVVHIIAMTTAEAVAYAIHVSFSSPRPSLHDNRGALLDCPDQHSGH